jgi:hypothetical protein
VADDLLRHVMHAAGADEGSEVRIFEVCLGSGRHLEIRVHDYGSDSATGRYAVELRNPQYPDASDVHMGNPEETIETALAVAHWQNFR